MERCRADLFKQLFLSHLPWLLQGLKKCKLILKDKQSRLFLTEPVTSRRDDTTDSSSQAALH